MALRGRELSDKAKEMAYADLKRSVALDGELETRVEALIFEQENLQIGNVAPDILGEDLDGVAFKLSDYRGKVVVVDFWGDW